MRSTRLCRAARGRLGAAILAVTATVWPLTAGVAAPAAAPAAARGAGLDGLAPAAAARKDAVLADPPPATPECPVTLNVVAHEDDDLLFINPSVSEDIAAGRCVVTLYVTAGDAGRTRSYWYGREQGPMDAYAAMAGVPGDWHADTIALAGHLVHRFRLSGARVTLLFLRLPDAHGSPTRPDGTLKELWLGTIPSLRTVDAGAVYTRPKLISTLTAVMNAYRPDQIRTLDYAGHYDDGDHEDHHTVGYLTLAAQRNYHAHHRITAYMGYPVAGRPDNLDAAAADTKLRYFLTYAPHDQRVCQSAEACLSNFYAPRFFHSIPTASS